MRSRSVPRDCSLRAGNRDANGLVAAAAAAVRAKDWARIGTCIARLRTSGWKSEQKVAGYRVRSRTARLGRLHTRLSCRLSCGRQMRLGRKKLAKVLGRPPPKEVADALFTYDGFLHGLGRMSLNLEAHGGLYTLHSHLNHSCVPNISVRHLDRRSALSRITSIAKRDIAVGEELVITYVDPSLGVRERRSQLGEWGFGQCGCERCVVEEHEGENGEDDLLARELTAGLGVTIGV